MPLDINPTAWALLAAGLLAPLLYLGTVVAGAAIRPGYSHVANAISELVEARAPHRIPLNIAFLVYNAFSIAFGIGITVVAANSTVVLAGWLLAATGGLGVLMSWFPMDPVGTPATVPGIGHLVIAGLMSVGTIAAIVAFAIGSASVEGWSGFSTYSYVTAGLVAATGAVAATTAARRRTTMGFWERLTIGAFLQWHLVLALRLITA